MAFPTFRKLYFSADGSILLILPLVDGFHGLVTVLLIRGQWITHSSLRTRLSRRFTCRIAHSFVVYDFPDVSHVVLPNAWQRIARSSIR